MSKVVVIGGGASGIISALVASKNNEVILLERNDKCGKKILLTGNGKCNYWNNNISLENYHTDSLENLEIILENKDKVLDFLSDLGIYPKIKNDYYYPNSNQASSMREILCKVLVKNNVNIIYNCKVSEIEKIDDYFKISSNLDDIICDKVIFAAGSNSAPKTGTDGNSYEILKKYHTINKVLPSLVPLKVKGDFLKDWNNIRVDAKLSLYVGNNLVDSEIGEVQLTDYGISGIPTFNLSGLASLNLHQNKMVNLKINFLPNINSVLNFLDERNRKNPNNTMEEMLESVLPYQLVFILLKKANINRDDVWDKVDIKNKKAFANLIESFNLEVIDTLDFDRSQVSIGGVSLKEINPNTMESLNIKNLYLVGELLDVDGKCGGFNLAFAFISGYIAGWSV